MAKLQKTPPLTLSTESVYGRSMAKDFPMGMRVLVVDDDTTCLRILERMLQHCRYDVTTCTMATKALSLLRESKGDFDVVISDVHMPDMNGFKLLELIGLEMDLPVIMMSADVRTSIVMQGIKHGACDYLIKPVRLEELKNIWQHVVRKKWKENRESEHSDSFEDDRNRRVADDAENTSPVNDATDNSSKSQKKKRDGKEDDESELDNGDSSSKKPRVVWSVELHQQFVNAVSQLGIDKAVPKRILDLMNVPGLTRENVASHLQKFRLYLKRLSTAQHHNGLPNSLPGAGSNAKVPSLGSLDFQTSTVSCQIPSLTLAAWQDELLGRSAGSLGMPAMDQPVLQQGAKSVPVEHSIAFSQPLMKCETNMPRQFPPSNVTVRGLSSGLPTWSSGNLGTVVCASNFGGLNGTQNSNVQVQMLQQQRLHPVLSESNCALNVQPSSLVLPSQVSKSFQVRENTVLANQNSIVVPSPSSISLQAGKISIPVNQNSIFASLRSSSSMQANNSFGLINQNSPLSNSQGGNNPGLINQNSTTGPSQPSNRFQGGNNPVLINLNSIMGPSQSSTSFQGGNNPGLINQNSMVVPPQPLTSFQEGSSPAPISYSSSYKNDSTLVDYSLLSSQSNNVQPGHAQVSDQGFKNATVLNSHSISKPISSSRSSNADVSTGWQAQTPDGNIGPINQPSCLMPNLSNIQGAGAQTLPDQEQGRNLGLPNLSNIQGGGTVSQTLPYQMEERGLGFVGKGTCIPCRFAMDDFESPTSGLSLDDDGDILNLDLFGCNGDL